MNNQLKQVVEWWKCQRTFIWGWVKLPLGALFLWFSIDAVLAGVIGKDEVKTALVNTGVFSLRVFAAIFFVHMLTHPKFWGWDLYNSHREKMQKILTGEEVGSQGGAFLVLAGEAFVKLLLLYFFLKALILWPQGIP